MSNIVPINQLKEIAKSTFLSGMFGLKNENQAFTLMMIAQAEGLHPIQAVQKYSVINGMPALKSTEIQARFQKSGGKVKWVESTSQKAIVKLSHPSYDGEYDSEYTIKDAEIAGLTTKDNWKRMPKNMLRARAISEGVRAVYPECLNNMYSDIEVQDIPQEATYEDAEIIEEPQIQSIEVLKLKLSNILKKDFNYDSKMIKEFAKFSNISEDAALIEELINNSEMLTEYVNNFEGK